jgi:hypothetical protein
MMLKMPVGPKTYEVTGKVKVQFALQQATKAQRGSVIALLFL